MTYFGGDGSSSSNIGVTSTVAVGYGRDMQLQPDMTRAVVPVSQSRRRPEEISRKKTKTIVFYDLETGDDINTIK